jgi:hypothetical protein
MNTVIVGIDPGVNGREPLSLTGGSGRRLAELIGVSDDEYVDRFDRINLHPIEGSDYDSLAGANLGPILRGRRVVVLGRRVANALGIRYRNWFEWDVDPRGFVFAVSPRLIGLSRWWNEPANRSVAESFYRGLTRPTIHVEGVDGSGKSTLARYLSDRLVLPIVPTDGPCRTGDDVLFRARARVVPGVVADRSSGVVSELVYGPVLRGSTIVPEDVLWGIVRAISGVVRFVYCRPPVDRIIHVPRPDEDPSHVRAVDGKIRDLYDRYDVVFDWARRIGCSVHEYDWTVQHSEEVLRCAGF